MKYAVLEEPEIETSCCISFPTGSLSVRELMGVLDTPPVGLTFVDKDDMVTYYFVGHDRAYLRTRSIIGRKVRNCHAPQGLDAVEWILCPFNTLLLQLCAAY